MSEPPATILVVDDQPETGHLMIRILKYLGHHGVHVLSGADALRYVRENPPAAVLLDYMMPGMDGLAVLREMRSDPQAHGLPIIMFSANNDPKVVKLAMMLGASEYWVKATVAVDEMGERLSRWLGPAGAAC